MDAKHYSNEELKLFFDPSFGEEKQDLEKQILEHLQKCETCSVLAKQVQSEMWGEIRSELKGF